MNKETTIIVIILGEIRLPTPSWETLGDFGMKSEESRVWVGLSDPLFVVVGGFGRDGAPSAPMHLLWKW